MSSCRAGATTILALVVWSEPGVHLGDPSGCDGSEAGSSPDRCPITSMQRAGAADTRFIREHSVWIPPPVQDKIHVHGTANRSNQGC
eukprot:750977-Amphidinium_carterae.2